MKKKIKEEKKKKGALKFESPLGQAGIITVHIKKRGTVH